jgi:hypothetical protein
LGNWYHVAVIPGAVDWLKAGPFKEKKANIAVRDATGTVQFLTIDHLKLAPSAAQGEAR